MLIQNFLKASFKLKFRQLSLRVIQSTKASNLQNDSHQGTQCTSESLAQNMMNNIVMQDMKKPHKQAKYDAHSPKEDPKSKTRLNQEQNQLGTRAFDQRL